MQDGPLCHESMRLNPLAWTVLPFSRNAFVCLEILLVNLFPHLLDHSVGKRRHWGQGAKFLSSSDFLIFKDQG